MAGTLPLLYISPRSIGEKVMLSFDKIKNKLAFCRGYEKMTEKLNPMAIIVFGTPFREMQGNIIPVDYLMSRRAVR